MLLLRDLMAIHVDDESTHMAKDKFPISLGNTDVLITKAFDRKLETPLQGLAVGDQFVLEEPAIGRKILECRKHTDDGDGLGNMQKTELEIEIVPTPITQGRFVT